MRPEWDALFESLYQENYEKMLIYASRLLEKRDLAEEVVQDAFCTALQKRTDVEKCRNPAAYVMSILKNKIREAKRVRQRELKYFLSLDDSVLRTVRATYGNPEKSYSGIVQEAKEALSEEDWTLFHQKYLDGETHFTIAKRMEISVWNSQKRAQRIRETLQDVLPDE